MAWVTLEKRIELENEKMALAFFRRALSKLPDSRRRQGIRFHFWRWSRSLSRKARDAEIGLGT